MPVAVRLSAGGNPVLTHLNTAQTWRMNVVSAAAIYATARPFQGRPYAARSSPMMRSATSRPEPMAPSM